MYIKALQGIEFQVLLALFILHNQSQWNKKHSLCFLLFFRTLIEEISVCIAAEGQNFDVSFQILVYINGGFFSFLRNSEFGIRKRDFLILMFPWKKTKKNVVHISQILFFGSLFHFQIVEKHGQECIFWKYKEELSFSRFQGLTYKIDF